VSDDALRQRLARYYPVFGVRVITPRLVLALPLDGDLLELLPVVEDGIHDPDRMPFKFPWTDTPTPQRDRDSLSHWWGNRAHWNPRNWVWSAAVFVDDHPIGVQSMLAHNFAVRRHVSTGSWIGMRYQGKGIGREMRAAVLHLAFAGLGADAAHSGYLEYNTSSRRVSEALGYEPNGHTVQSIRGEPVTEQRVIMHRSAWEARRRVDIEIEGLEPALSMFGLG
jgi:RimJ/RimL family protein N-acetyltransferase